MARVPRCPSCREAMEYDDRRRAWECHECEETEALDQMLEHPDRTPTVYEYDEEDRP